ncbi:MAG: hypothetical protein ACE5GX_01905 [Thermoanaerobaculia bacterium]
MKQQSSCESPCCPSAPLKRPRYFPRQLITPAEMNLEQSYFRERHKLHNRMLHGWGTVCGALVCPILDEVVDENGNQHEEARPWCVIVKPGYLLGPCGDEIYIDTDEKVDLRSACVQGTTGEPSSDAKDPWCSEVWVKRDAGPIYVAVRYREVLARPVPVQPAGCGCDDASCEYSRWCDGYEICILPECPQDHRDPPNIDDLFQGPIPPCPPCPECPWVVLAEVEIGPNGEILRIDNCSCRRMVISFGEFWWQCEDEACQPARGTAIDSVDIVEGEAIAGREFMIAVKGRGFPLDAELSAKDVSVATYHERSPELITATVKVADGAQPGARTLAVSTVNGIVLAERRNAILVASKATPEPGDGKRPVRKKKAVKKTAPRKKTAKRKTKAKKRKVRRKRTPTRKTPS